MLIITKTPQRAPLAMMLLMRLTAASVKLAGKFATTSTRYGSAISPAEALYSSIEWNSWRRYTWMTFSMCFVRSANRCSMWPGVGPDAAGHQLFVEIGQVHEGGEVVAQPDRIDDREADLARRHGGQQPQHRALQEIDRSGAARAAGLQQQERTLRERQHDRQRELGLRGAKPLVLRHAVGHVGQFHLAARRSERPAEWRPAASSRSNRRCSNWGTNRGTPDRIG